MIPVSTAPPEHGTTSAQPVSMVDPTSSVSSAQNWFPSLSTLVPSNAILVMVGIVLALGALLISQKETVIQVARTAAEV